MMLLASLAAKSAIVIAVGLAATWVARDRSASVRHWLLACAVLVALALPLVSLVAPAWSMPQRAVAASNGAVDVHEEIVLPPTASESAGATVSGRALPSLSSIVLGIWAAGATACFAALLVGLGRLRGISAGALEVDGDWLALSESLSRRLGLDRPVPFRETDRASLLVTWGIGRRAEVLLPEGAGGWPVDRASLVAVHELAHIARRDWPVQLSAEFLRCLHWFNPLMWIACRRLRLESEYASDDVVLEMGFEGTDYAGQLLDLARAFSTTRAPAVPALAMARPSTLQQRIRAMLNASLDRSAVSRRIRLGLVLGALVAVVPLAGFGQATGTVSGTITDSTGRRVPGVTVKFVSSAFKMTVQTTTADNGGYDIPIIAGEYQLEASKPGFENYKAAVTVTSGERTEKSIALTVGTLQETISVANRPVTLAPITEDQKRAMAEKRTADEKALTEKIARSAATPCTATDEGGRIKPPMKVRDVRPVYPEGLELSEPVEVKLEATIGRDGKVTEARAISEAPPVLIQAAEAAVKQWEFTSTLLNCEPIEVKMKVAVTFK